MVMSPTRTINLKFKGKKANEFKAFGHYFLQFKENNMKLNLIKRIFGLDT